MKILRRNWVKSVFTYLQTFHSVFLIRVSTLFSKLKLLGSFTTNIISTCDNFLFLCRIDQHCVNLSVFSSNAGKYGPEKLLIWTLFTQCRSDRAFILLQSGHLVISLLLSQILQVERRHFFFRRCSFLEIAIVKLFSLPK